jgi:hypothetical protein
MSETKFHQRKSRAWGTPVCCRIGSTVFQGAELLIKMGVRAPGDCTIGRSRSVCWPVHGIADFYPELRNRCGGSRRMFFDATRRYQCNPFKSALCVASSGSPPAICISAMIRTPAHPPPKNAAIAHQTEIILSPPSVSPALVVASDNGALLALRRRKRLEVANNR